MDADLSLDLAAWLLTFACHGGICLLGAAALTRVLALPVPIEEIVWRFALVAGLATASLQLACGGAPLAAVALRAAPPVAPGASGPAVADLGARPPLGPAFDVAAAPTAGLDPAAAVVWVALAAAALGLARLGRQRLALRAVLADRRPILPGSPAAQALEDLTARAGYRRRVRLSLSTAIDAPVAFGLLRPEICLPRRALHEVRPACRDAMLAHELAHLVRRDPLWLECAHSLAALFPWLPGLRLAGRRLRALAEFGADALGAQLVSPVEVAGCLVEVAGWLAEGRGAAVEGGLVGMTIRRDGLGARVDRLLDPGPGTARPSPLRVGLGCLLATAALAAALPGARGRAVQPAAGPAAVQPADPRGNSLRGLADEVAADCALLRREVTVLRRRADGLNDDPAIDRLFVALDAQLRAVESRHAALAAAIEAYEGAFASTESLTHSPEMFR
jgi:Zn-dependent protease with chaperone function